MAQILSGHGRPRPEGAARNDVSSGSEERETAETLEEDAIFDILRARRRRIALRKLHEHGGEASIGALAEHVAAAENDVEREAVVPSQRKRAYVALYQNHLPKIANHGVIDYDRDAGLVRLREPARSVLPYLYYVPSMDDLPAADDGGSSLRSRVRRLIRG